MTLFKRIYDCITESVNNGIPVTLTVTDAYCQSGIKHIVDELVNENLSIDINSKNLANITLSDDANLIILHKVRFELGTISGVIDIAERGTMVIAIKSKLGCKTEYHKFKW